MTVPLGKIVTSTSHVLYEARIYDAFEVATPPNNQDFSFGSFVGMSPNSHQTHKKTEATQDLIVGIVTNSRLLNPDLGHYGPRLTVPHEQNAVFAPDYLNELGVMVSILLLGYLTQGAGKQTIVREVLSVGQEIRTLSEEELQLFHRSPNGTFQMHYIPIIMESGTLLTTGLIQSIGEQLRSFCSPKEQQMLTILHKHLMLQSTLGAKRGR